MMRSYEEAEALFRAIPAHNKTPSHHPAYVALDALRDPQLTPCYFVFQHGEDIFFHGFISQSVPGASTLVDVQSPLGHGGPVSSSDDWSFLKRAWEVYLAWGHDHGVLAEFIRFHPLLSNWNLYGGEHHLNRETVWIDLMVGDPLMQFKTRARTATRKAMQTGLQVVWRQDDAAWQAFMNLYGASMARLGAEADYRFPEARFMGLKAWSKAHLALCMLEEKVVAGAVFLLDGPVMEYHLSAADDQGRRMAATNLILHQAALLGQQEGAEKLHLGGGTDSAPDNPLLFFKAGFSKQRAQHHVGMQVHKPDTYEALKAAWRSRHANREPPKRTLFYRA
ncbi:MAG: GNAT family N-acetyltransferase [Magnetococcales bacterium]|nr:GNAT family N-acetyltransferase [Magnetococcales bacterium]